MSFLASLFGRKKGLSPEGNPALLRAMHEVATKDNPENRRALYEAMLSSTLLTPIPEIPPGLGPGLQTLQSGVQLQLVRLKDSNNLPVTVAFSDLEALRNWDPNTPYIGLKSIDLFRAVLSTDIQGVLINPFDTTRKTIRPGGQVTRRELEQLATGAVPINKDIQEMRLKAQEKVALGLPANPPSTAIQEILRNKAQETPPIAELYFFQMARSQNQSGTVIGILLSENAGEKQRDEIIQTLVTAIKPELKSGQFLDFMFLQGPFGEQIRKIGKLIFRRS